ncbi:MAG: exopolysaccharide biosynthesis protein [Caulobacter sp.]|nr:exopolysaccharide biosynthesis protein [Caulobacter sp.]
MDPIDRLRPLSQVMADIAAEPGPMVTVGEIVERLGGRAFGAMLFVFSAPNWLPLPPGSSTFLAAPLVVLTPQLLAGVKSPWLPEFIARRAIQRKTLAKAFGALIPWLKRIEHVSRPRLIFLFGPLGQHLIGAICLVLSLVLLLPIPLGNMAPAAAIALFGLAMVQRDGLLALLGLAVTAVSGGLLLLAVGIITTAVNAFLASRGLVPPG